MALTAFTPEQQMQRLRYAHTVRKERALLKWKLKNKALTIEDLWDLVDDPNNIVARRLRVDAFLRSMPRIGSAKSALICERTGIPPQRYLQGVGTHQRDHLTQLLSGVIPTR